MSIIEEITKKVTNMPMLSVVASKLLEITNDRNHSAKDIVSIVENDASLTTRVLKIANSAAYYRGNPISTISRAVVHLGEKTIMEIAIGSSTEYVLNRPLKGYESAAGELWDHSLCAAIAAREIANFTNDGVTPELAFTSGLLHDIGKSIISEFLEGNAESITKLWDNRLIRDYLEAEKNLIGTDHANVGYEIARHWKLPEPLCAAILFHHRPNETDPNYRKLVYYVHLGDVLAMLEGLGTGADALAYNIDQGYREYIALDKDDLAYLILTIQEKFSKTKSSILASQEE